MLLMTALAMQTMGSSGSSRSSRSRCAWECVALLAFAFGSMIVAAAAIYFLPNRAVAIDRRLEELTSPREDRSEDSKPRLQAFWGVVKRVVEKCRDRRRRWGHSAAAHPAGFRREEALTTFFGIRVMFALRCSACSPPPSS